MVLIRDKSGVGCRIKALPNEKWDMDKLVDMFGKAP